MPALRSDAARSRAKILEAARGCPLDDLRLNEVARAAGVGVGTVYRHFPTVTALIEALSFDALEQTVDLARTAAEEPDAGRGFVRFLRGAVRTQLEHEGLQQMWFADDVSTEARALRAELFDRAGALLDAAVAAGAVRPDLSIGQVQRLVCGVEHAVRLGNGQDQDLLLDIMLSGLAPPRDDRPAP
ncbi:MULTISPECIES: TetR/AcrR family transcriptional regulator [unclassified Brachybacterium]|uniref:TetR/AcrR family transcriptional regulator n=1 Tax=unclassified Brachybacterium TaxID=2623841 RepID=UPI0036222CC6